MLLVSDKIGISYMEPSTATWGRINNLGVAFILTAGVGCKLIFMM